MIFSYDWLRQYLSSDGDVERAADLLTAAGLACEGIEARGDDFLLDLDVTTNRPDCMSHFGVARELSVLLRQPLRSPETGMERDERQVEQATDVQVEDVIGCPRYVAMVVEGVKVGPSPDWLVDRLESIGQRPINNVVDVTNFVLWELGQPIHAVDLDRLRERRIVVRRAADGEKFTTLDEEERRLDARMLVIADGERTVALAGLMGGLDSEVTQKTTSLLIESAHFDPSVVRHAGKVLGLHTDASHRFERGADPGVCLFAAQRVVSLLCEIAGGRALSGAIDVRNRNLDFSLRGRLEMSRLNRFAGLELDRDSVAGWLEGLGFGLEPSEPLEGASVDPGAWKVSVPTWRFYDFVRDPGLPLGAEQGEVFESDFFEEALRIHGYEDVPSSLPAIGGPDGGSSDGYLRRERIRRHLAGDGYCEAITYAFHDLAAERAWPALSREGEPVRLANPLSELYSVMRRSLLPGLVAAAEYNQRRGGDTIRLFEIAHVFPGCESEELESVAIVGGGSRGTDWDRRVDFDLFDLKGVVERLAGRFELDLEARPASLSGFVEGTGCELWVRGDDSNPHGYLGRLDIDSQFPLFAAELRGDQLGGAGVQPVRLPSRHPGIEVDLTLTHGFEISWAEISRALEAFGVQDLVSWGLKGRYVGKGVPEGAVNTTMFFLYNAEDRSLTQDEVNQRHQELAGELESRFGWRPGG